MPRSTTVLAIIVFLLPLTGCTGFQPSTPTAADTPTPPPTATSTETQTPTQTSTTKTRVGTDCPPVLTVNNATPDQLSRINQTLEYENLPAERQQEFRAAVNDLESGGYGTVQLDDSLPSTWSTARIVEYQGEQYYTVAAMC